MAELGIRELKTRASEIVRRVRERRARYSMQFGTTLVTLDREQRERLSRAVPTKSPADLV